jgi:hypothetical protein
MSRAFEFLYRFRHPTRWANYETFFNHHGRIDRPRLFHRLGYPCLQAMGMEGGCPLHFGFPSMNSQAGSDHFGHFSVKWLHNDKECQLVRHISFDFDALCRRVVDICPGAGLILTYGKKKGGSNRALIFTTDNSKIDGGKIAIRQRRTSSASHSIRGCNE